MNNSINCRGTSGQAARGSRVIACLLVMAVTAGVVACGTGKGGTKKEDFFTSGSREADQRATQRMAKNEQLSGSGEGSGEKGVKKAKTGDSGTNVTQAAQAEGKLALYDRLGAEQGITAIIDDFTGRVLADPRVNWPRKGIKRGGFLSSNRSVTWNPTPQNVANLKKHMVQFISLATGGPTRYEGKEMQAVHADMKITNPEFDAAVGDLKATLDKLQIPNKEQKELLAVIESTRPQIVTER